MVFLNTIYSVVLVQSIQILSYQGAVALQKKKNEDLLEKESQKTRKVKRKKSINNE